MGQRRGSAIQVMGLGMTLLCLIALAQPTFATVYYVGGSTGWTFNVNSWTNGKTFKAGDYLVFKYNKTYHDVVKVGKAAYKRCTVPEGAKVYQTGKDIFRLKKGLNYFICSLPTHCKSLGMKITVNAI